MNKSEWVERIKCSCKQANTYAEWCDDVIESLATILELRDAAKEQYDRLGAQPIVKYTNKGGNTNPTKNPALILWNDLNSSALAYWRELGLTPSGFKKLTGDPPAKDYKKTGIAAILREYDEIL